MAISGFSELYAERLANERDLFDRFVAEADPVDLAEFVQSQKRLSEPADMWLREGATSGEIDQVRESWGGWLPESLEAYLLLLGREGYFFETGFNCRYPAILNAASAVESWFVEMDAAQPEWYGDGKRFRIPDGARHLGHHGGYIFYFVLDRSEDPVVYVMDESSAQESAVRSLATTISEMVVEAFRVPRRLIERGVSSSVRRRSR